MARRSEIEIYVVLHYTFGISFRLRLFIALILPILLSSSVHFVWLRTIWDVFPIICYFTEAEAKLMDLLEVFGLVHVVFEFVVFSCVSPIGLV